MASKTSKPDFSRLIAELKALKNDNLKDEEQRRELYASLKEASLAIETPLETVNRIVFAVCLQYKFSTTC